MIWKNKSGQVTLFIILAILFVVAIVIILYYFRPGMFFQRLEQPRLEDCISTSLDSKIKTLALTAGLEKPQFNYMYNGRNHTYLCYTAEYYQPCINQEPFLTQAFENSLAKVLKEEFQSCYVSSVEDLKRRGYDVEQGVAKFNISIEPGEVIVSIDAPMIVSSEETTVRTQEYTYRHRTNLYEVLMVATSLIQFETYYGDSEQTIQMFFYPNVIIDKRRRDDDTKVYTLTEKNEKIEYLFAVKSFPYPAGGII